ncbi:MAG TPA: phosphatidate cytidylyltransferase [Chloroflexota bacterium]|nr:phosphatidate cytidylyltransferase [Chloroflexota bacterium]
MALRILSAAVGIPIVLVANYLGGPLLDALVGLTALVAAMESARLVLPAGRRVYVVFVPATVTASLIPAFSARPQAAWVALLVGASILVAAYELAPGIYSERRGGWWLNLTPVLYVGVLLGFLLLLHRARHGPWWVFLVLVMTWAYDSGALIAGSRFGRHPFMRHVSPKKTVEGVAGGLILSGLAGLAGSRGVGITFWQGAILGLLTGAAAQFGDLVESMMKRQAGVKDSGSVMPGHGGILDRIDSLLLTGTLGYCAALLLGYAP